MLTEYLAPQLSGITAQMPATFASVFDDANADIAAALEKLGLAVGDRAPDFSLRDQDARKIHLTERLAAGPVVLVFYRGDWCPYCNLTLRSWQHSLDELRTLGADLLAVSPQKCDRAASLTERHDLRFSVLSDIRQATIAAYGLQYTVPAGLEEFLRDTMGLDVRYQTGDGSMRLPIPATYLIGTDGHIAVSDVEVDFRHRMEPAEMLDEIRRIG